MRTRVLPILLAAFGLVFVGAGQTSPAKPDPKASGAQIAGPLPESIPADEPSKLPAPPEGLSVRRISAVAINGTDDAHGIGESVQIAFHNDTDEAFEAVEIEITTSNGEKTYRRRTILDGRFPDALALHTGSLLPRQATPSIYLRWRIPIEHYVYGRMMSLRVLGARPASKPLNLDDPDTVWTFMRTASPDEIADAFADVPGLREYRNVQGVSPTLMACFRSDVEALDAALEGGGSLKDRTKRNLGPLHLAAAAGSEAMVARLVRAGAPLEEISVYGQTPLHVAVMHRNATTAEALGRQGAKLEARDATGSTPLILVPSADAPEVAEVLIALGADLRASGGGGVTYQGAAAAFDNVALLEIGLRHGLKLDEADPETGLTPLHWAARYGRRRAADWLLSRGANPDLKSRDGLTALELFHQHHAHPVDRQFMEATFTRYRKDGGG